MKGTEKQIKWAEDIIETVKTVFNNAETAQSNHAAINQVKEMHDRIINNMNNGNASDIIDDFKSIVITGKVMEDYASVLNRIVVCEKTKGREYRK